MNRFSPNRAMGGLTRCAYCLLALMPAVSLAGDKPDPPGEFTLGAYVPEDVWFFAHHVKNPERAWIDQAWAGVLRAANKSGVVGDVASILLSPMDADDKSQAREGIDRATRLINAVDWSALTAREFVFAQRMAACCVGYEYVLLMRGTEESGDVNFRALSAIQNEIASLVGSSVAENSIGGVPVRSLRFNTGELKQLGFSIELFRRGDLLGVVTGQKLLTDVIALVTGKSAVAPLRKSKRFAEAIANVPTPRDSIIFFDVKRFVGDFDLMLDKFPQPKRDAYKRNQGAKESAADAANAKRRGSGRTLLLRELIREADIVDYSVTTTTTEGMKEWSRSYTRLQHGAKDKRLAKAVFDRQPFEQFDRFIPANALGFSLSPTVDIGRLYKSVTALVTPDIAAKLSSAEAKLAEMGFDLQEDLFDWLSGETISIEMPAAVVTPMSRTDKVLMIRVKNPDLAAKKINRGINKIAALMQGKGQMLMITPAPVNAKGFRQVTHPLLAMLFRPVIGVYEDWLILGTSAEGINACLAVAAGEAPSISTNVRFQREGLTPKASVRSASYEDTSNWGRDKAQMLTMVGMLGPMVLAGIPETSEDGKEIKPLISGLMSIAMKVGPILQRIDFYSSEASVSVYDGDRTIRTESLVTYKKPAPPTLPPAAPTFTHKVRKPGK